MFIPLSRDLHSPINNRVKPITHTKNRWLAHVVELRALLMMLL